MSHSPLDLSDNPVRRARQKTGKSISQAAEEAKINWQTWYLTECGCYDGIPPAILSFFRRRGVVVSQEEYTWFRNVTQREFGRTHFTGKGLPPFKSTVPPIEAFRVHCGIARRAPFAKGLCVQVAFLFKLEHGETKHLPRQVYSALLTAGLPVEEVEELDERTVEYYEGHGYR